MNPKILFASFALVFLAELGDKTQLTALAFSASSRSPWSVFLGTSLALILTTALAVVFGEFIARHVPERFVHIASGVMFVLVGLILLVNVARKVPGPASAEEAAEPTAEHPPSGPVSSFILRQAGEFERDLVTGLEESADALEAGELRDAVLAIAEEHRGHLKSLTDLSLSDVPETEKPRPGGPEAALLRLLETADASDGGENPDVDPLRVAVRKQEAAAEFYLALARLIHLHDARDTLRWLAMDEIRHAEQLCSLINHSESTVT